MNNNGNINLSHQAQSEGFKVEEDKVIRPKIPIDFDTEVKLTTHKILQLAADHNIPSDVMMASIADVIGIAAATLDKHTGHQNLNDRIHALYNRTKETYNKIRNTIDTNASYPIQ